MEHCQSLTNIKNLRKISVRPGRETDSNRTTQSCDSVRYRKWGSFCTPAHNKGVRYRKGGVFCTAMVFWWLRYRKRGVFCTGRAVPDGAAVPGGTVFCTGRFAGHARQTCQAVSGKSESISYWLRARRRRICPLEERNSRRSLTARSSFC